AWEYAKRLVWGGTLPLWNPYQMCGTAFLAAQLHGVLYPLHWVLFFLPLPYAARIALFGHIALAMGGAYWCARVFGIGRPAALLAGVGDGFAGSGCDGGPAPLPPLFLT